jgi:hypothetical protein
MKSRRIPVPEVFDEYDTSDGSPVDKVPHSSSEYHHLLTSSVYHTIPKFYVALICSRFDDNSCLVYTHADLVDRNILFQNGRITGIFDWDSEWAGFYPEHWGFVQFMTNLDDGMWAQGEYDNVYPACNVLPGWFPVPA